MEAVTTDTSVEIESTEVAILGSVTAEDGRQISFDVDLQLYREAAQSTTVRTTTRGSPPPAKDPLALSFGAAPSLSSRRAQVDVDGDGTPRRDAGERPVRGRGDGLPGVGPQR
jgi:hypothetical protein